MPCRVQARKPVNYGIRVDLPGPGVTYCCRHPAPSLLPLLEKYGFDSTNLPPPTPQSQLANGVATIPDIFDKAVRLHEHRNMLGTRPILRRIPPRKGGRGGEKLELGGYQWQTFGQVKERVDAFGAGLIHTGHKHGEKLAIVADTRADWFIALQGAFQQGLVVVTAYATLGVEALVYSLNEVGANEMKGGSMSVMRLKRRCAQKG